MTQSVKTLRIANLVALIIMLAVNGLTSTTALIGGQLTAEVSDKYANLFTPAGYVFSIWGVIYIGLIAFAIFQTRRQSDALVQKIGPWFAINGIVNAVWLFLWGFEILWASVIAMLVLLGTLIILYERIGIGRTTATRAEKWAVHIPFSLYTGWISVATIANVAVALVSSGWTGGALGPYVWAVLMLVIGTALGLLAAMWRRDVAYALVIVWAFIGIAVAHPQESLIMAIAISGAVLVLMGIIFAQVRHPRAQRSTT